MKRYRRAFFALVVYASGRTERLYTWQRRKAKAQGYSALNEQMRLKGDGLAFRDAHEHKFFHYEMRGLEVLGYECIGAYTCFAGTAYIYQAEGIKSNGRAYADVPGSGAGRDSLLLLRTAARPRKKEAGKVRSTVRKPLRY